MMSGSAVAPSGQFDLGGQTELRLSEGSSQDGRNFRKTASAWPGEARMGELTQSSIGGSRRGVGSDSSPS